MSTVRCWKSLIMVLPCLVFMAGCSRPNSGGVSRLVIQAPENFGKAGAFAVPANRKACWGANITGEKIEGQAATVCSPATGVVAGYKLSGEKIEASVLKGEKRKIDLYLYLLPENSAGPCPAMTANFPASQLTATYLVGSATADFISDTTEVDIVAVYPGDGRHLAVTAALPAVCVPVAAPAGPGKAFNNASASATVAGSGLKIKARVGGPVENNTVIGSGLKIKVK